MSRLSRLLEHLETALTVSRDDLAKVTGVGTRSIENDIRALNRLLSPTAHIVLQHNGRYRLVVLDPEGYRGVQLGAHPTTATFNDDTYRHAFIFESLLIADAPVVVDSLVADMKVSRSTAMKDVAKVRAIIAEFGVELKSRTNVGYWLEGPELAIRQVILDVFFDDIYCDTVPTWQQEVVSQIAAAHSLDSETTERLARWHTVAIDRIQSKHPLMDLPASFEQLLGTAAHTCAQELLAETRPFLPLVIPETEELFLSLPLAVLRNPLAENEFSRVNLSTDDQNLVQSIMAVIQKEMDLSLNVQDFNLLEKFVQHIALLVNRMRYNIKVTLPQVSAIRDSYPVAFRMALLAKSVIEQSRSGVINDTELDYIAAYFEVFLRNQRKFTIDTTRIGILGREGTVYTMLLQSQLHDLLPTVELVQIVDPQQPIDESHFDVLIASPNTQVATTDLPILRLRPDFDEQEFRNWLHRAWAHSRWGAQLSGLDSLVAALPSAELFFVLEPADHYQQQQMLLLQAMVDKGVLNDELRSAVEKREQSRTMQLSDYLAFPHLSSPQITELQFAVGVVPRAESETGVRVVYLLLLPEDVDTERYVGLIVQLYDEILRLAGNHEFLSKLSTSTNIHDYQLQFLKGNPL